MSFAAYEPGLPTNLHGDHDVEAGQLWCVAEYKQRLRKAKEEYGRPNVIFRDETTMQLSQENQKSPGSTMVKYKGILVQWLFIFLLRFSQKLGMEKFWQKFRSYQTTMLSKAFPNVTMAIFKSLRGKLQQFARFANIDW